MTRLAAGAPIVVMALAAAAALLVRPGPQVPKLRAGHVAGETVIGATAEPAAAGAVRRQAKRLILRPGHPAYSVLWLQALGATHVLTSDAAKYDALLEAEGGGLYHVPVRHPGPAVLVSRRLWQNLPPLRSLYDRPSLEAYVEWSNRPEGAGFRWRNEGEAEVNADLGPDDMILIRQSGAGWSAGLDGQPVAVTADPIRRLLLDPQRTGPVTILLRRTGHANAGAALPEHAIPVLNPGGIVDGVRFTPPPFAPGAVVTMHGSGLGGARTTRVLVGGRAAEILYAGEEQINARLPWDLPAGTVEVVAEVSGRKSNVLVVEIHR